MTKLKGHSLGFVFVWTIVVYMCVCVCVFPILIDLNRTRGNKLHAILSLWKAVFFFSIFIQYSTSALKCSSTRTLFILVR